MGTNSNGARQNIQQPIKVWELNQSRLALMHQKLAETPRILSRSAGRTSCCIFKVPQSLIDINGRSYHPHVVSIGSYHHADPRLKMIEEHKWRFLGTLLKRTRGKGLILEDYLKAVYPLEVKTRECYSTEIHFSSDEFVEMLVLDGRFVIELFRKFGGVTAFESDDPPLALSWVYAFFLRDLIRLENQIPFFVLECLFDLTRLPNEESGPSLRNLTLRFFDNAFQRTDDSLEKFEGLKAKHVLYFLRSSFIPNGYQEPTQITYTNTHVIHCISKLRRAGIQLKPGKEGSFLAIKFSRGVIEMSTIPIDDFMSAFLINCVAYEQCHRACSKHMTNNLDCLINTYSYVEYLCDQDIIENYLKWLDLSTILGKM